MKHLQYSPKLCSSNSLPPYPLLQTSVISTKFTGNQPIQLLKVSPCLQLKPLRVNRCSAATQEIVETTECESGYVETGYISNAHGLQGEVRIKPNTDFPELRFSQPGKRWLRQYVSGRETIQEVELVDGRDHPGQKSWILKFSGIDTVDQARQLVGSTVLVKEEDRPELDEDEFYTRDLVGMRVTLKETGEPVGTVVNVFNSGASDLLHVMLDSSMQVPHKAANPEARASVSNRLVWVPFVEAIVPHVDMNRREMHITPPNGLLELNLRADERSKKERRQLEWKQRKKLQQRLIAAKKKLCEMEQKHVFHGLRFGEKDQRGLLANEIVGVNSKLLQQTLQNIDMPSKRWDFSEFIHTNLSKLQSNTMKLPETCLTSPREEETADTSSTMRQKGLNLLSEGKLAMVFIIDDGKKYDPDLVDSKSAEDSFYSCIETLFTADLKYLKAEDRLSTPLIVICSSGQVPSIEKLFLNHEHFSFDSEKIWYFEEEKLPVVSSSLDEKERHKILMKSPWEILQSPVGTGGAITLLSSGNILDNLSNLGVDYVQICSINQKYIACDSPLLGFVNSCKADVGIQFFRNEKALEENVNAIFSLKFMKTLSKQINKLQFYAMAKAHSHVEYVDKGWIDVTPSSPNSYELHCSIYGSLNCCSLDKVCLVEVTQS
ncbi:RimM, N-terminal [Dillenia turbinata]|uniref:RimM, N-terminal n=1 Tax=Dillenia turbinata TaxID=194707 RepID=A0AAN8VDD0_9MAGN